MVKVQEEGGGGDGGSGGGGVGSQGLGVGEGGAGSGGGVEGGGGSGGSGGGVGAPGDGGENFGEFRAKLPGDQSVDQRVHCCLHTRQHHGCGLQLQKQLRSREKDT